MCKLYGEVSSLWVGEACIPPSSIKRATVSMPSSCEMIVCRGKILALTKAPLVGRGGSFSIRLGKCFVSLMCDGRILAGGWIKRVI